MTGSAKLYLIRMFVPAMMMLASTACGSDDPTGTQAVAHTVSFVIGVQAPSNVSGAAWSLRDASGAELRAGTLRGGATDSFAIDVRPGVYTVIWPETIVTVDTIGFATRAASQSVTITDETTVVRATTALEAVTGALVAHVVIDGAPSDLPAYDVEGLLVRASDISGFHARPDAIRQFLTPGTYALTWPSGLTIKYGNVTYQLKPVVAQTSLDIPAAFTPVETTVHFAVAQSAVLLQSGNWPSISFNFPAPGAPATLTWVQDGQAVLRNCQAGSGTVVCPNMPVGVPIHITFPALTLDGRAYSPQPASADFVIPSTLSPPVVKTTYVEVTQGQ